MKFQRDEIIQQYAAILEYGKGTVRSTSAIQFSIKDVKEALEAEWWITKLREDKDDVWKSKYQDVLENSYLHMAIFVPQEEYETAELYESLRQAIDKIGISTVKRQEDTKELIALTPKYTKIQGDVTDKMAKLKSELQEMKNTLKLADILPATASKVKRPWWKIW